MIKVGDMVICRQENVIGVVTKKYFPTACEEQTMITTVDGRQFHAPTRMFERINT